MIKTKSLLLSVILLFAAGCSDKKEKKTVPEKNITACTTVKEVNCSEKNESQTGKVPTLPEGSIILKSIKDETYSVLIEENRFLLNGIEQPIVLVNFFSTWCPPCRGQIPYFEDLQKKYGTSLFVTGILVNDDINASKMGTFYSKHHVNYFISNGTENKEVTEKVTRALKLDANFTLPLTVLYRNGDYYTHYEGPVPVEMIDHDIKTAIEEN